ncbi:hemolysin family protein [Thermodesulfatator indicus]
MSEENPSVFKAIKEIFRKSPQEEAREFTEEITELIEEGEDKGLLSPEEGEIIINILEVRNVPIREVMVPRKDIVALEVNADFEKIKETILQKPHTRYPVYEKDLDQIVGITHIKDLFRLCKNDNPSGLKELLRAPYIIPENLKLIDLLTEFRKRREQIALVIDESGVIVGLVTLIDLFEEILGEETPVFPRDQEGWYIADGLVRIDDVERILKIKLPRGPYETISGFIINQAGRIPEKGERFRFDGLHVEVLSADERRIKKIRFRKDI